MKYYFILFKKFFSFHATNKKLLLELFITAVIRTVFSLGIPLVAAMVIDAATEQDYTRALIYVALFLVVSIAYVFFHHLNYVAYAKNSVYIHNTLQRMILDKVVALDQDYTKKISHAEIVNTGFEDVTKCQRIPDYLFDFIIAVATVVIDAIILIFVDPLIGAITLGLTLISLAIFVFHMKKRDYYADLRRTHQDEISNLYNQIIDGHKEVHAFNLEENLKGMLQKEKLGWNKRYLRQRLHSDLGGSLTPLLQGVGRIITYLLAAGLILKGEYNVATLVLVVGYYENMHESYDYATDIIAELSHSFVAINRVHRLLSYRPPRQPNFGNDDQDNIKGEVVFKNVSFAYGRRPLMRNVSFSLAPSSLTGFVGKSGSGKSTIFRLLLRLYKPTQGSITIDGKNINDYTKSVYATNVGIVTQKPFIFDMTIRQNLSLVDPDPEHQIAACKKAGVHDAIMRLEKGYDTPLISDGGNLSTGHKQLLALARTLLSKSEILLFDEVTSALDADTTKQVIAVLKKLKKDHTVLVVTHKPEVMRQMDELIVIDQGRMVGRGTHKNLLHNKYYQLLQK